MAEVTGFKGKLDWDTSKPDGTPRKLMNVDKLGRLGWKASIELRAGLEATYQWFLKHQDGFKSA
jgi:GDP-L-fucose synthase